MTRTIAIGDLHGYLEAFNALLEIIRPGPDDTIVTLGDYFDRGPNSRGVLDRLIQLEKECHLVPLFGNHDQIVLDLADGNSPYYNDWLQYGGDTTLASYGCDSPADFPKEHLDFLRRCVPWYETESHIFVHASYERDLPMEEQPGRILRWDSLRDRLPGPHRSGKKVIVGHTAQKNGCPLILEYLICIDTWIYGDGYLTALNVDTNQILQVDQAGRLKGASR
ncbi:MAG: metallophosphoesterase [Planctomycetia bacterium]|jgi:serine/threonine protein phosphatase 1